MTARADSRVSRVETGVRALDEILGGGLPSGSVSVVAGPPGSGKTILAQQVCFRNASANRRVLYFNTLSEPTAKMLRDAKEFDYFDATKLDESLRVIDLGILLRSKGLESAIGLMMDQVRTTKPALVVVDSFKVFNDLAGSGEDLRKFAYEVVVNLMAWEATALLLGEYGPHEYDTNAVFSVIDGIIALTHGGTVGEQARRLRVLKMRGTRHSTAAHTFSIGDAGIEVFAPSLTIRPSEPTRAREGEKTERIATGIANLDKLLGPGVPVGSSIVVAGDPGTGKTLLLLELIYRGALAGEKGMFVSFEQSERRVRAMGRDLGWDLDREIERGTVKLLCVRQTDIEPAKHVLMIQQAAGLMGAQRIAVDSLSMFLRRLADVTERRDAIAQFATVIQNSRAVGFFAADIDGDAEHPSPLAGDESALDGVIRLTAIEEGLGRERYLEVYKMRNTPHLRGRHGLRLGAGGVQVFPRYESADAVLRALAPDDSEPRVSTGVPGLDELLGGGLRQRSVTVIAGPAGSGKSTLAAQFICAGASANEPALFLSFDVSASAVVETAEALHVPLRTSIHSGRAFVVRLSDEDAAPVMLLSVVGAAIERIGARRLVVDGALETLVGRADSSLLRHLLHALVTRCRRLGVATLFTLESNSSADLAAETDRVLSPIVDNVVVLSRANGAASRVATVSIVKSRGSAHDPRSHVWERGVAGFRVGEPVS